MRSLVFLRGWTFAPFQTQQSLWWHRPSSRGTNRALPEGSRKSSASAACLLQPKQPKFSGFVTSVLELALLPQAPLNRFEGSLVGSSAKGALAIARISAVEGLPVLAAHSARPLQQALASRQAETPKPISR